MWASGGNAWPGRPIRLTNVSALHDVFNWAVRPTRNNDFPHRPLWCLCPFFRSLSCKIDVL